MQIKQAQNLVKDTFENRFDKNRFYYLIKNLLNEIEEEDKDRFVYRGNFIPDAYKPYIKTLERIGKYQDPKHNKIDLLIVQLKKETSLEHARTMQRNFIAWYLNGSRGDVLKDAALVAFVSPNQDDWRFSLVKMQYRLGKKGEIKQELTPAKRFSFLVGENEASHTAQSRLVPLIIDDENNPTLDQLEEAFNIEKVTKEFFEKYRELFLWVKDELEKLLEEDKKIKRDFKQKNVNTIDFAKKLLGQIVFLYFLQKKGWFGVQRDADWGTGPKDFLRRLFEKQIVGYENFFNEILEPLFYEALARERDDNFYSRFNCKIPFLNGGLFDPLNDYDWVHTDINLPNELFSNEIKTKEGDTGTGILDVFDRYNFTVKEDEPLDKEVAVDPEMLGKVFENLLEVKDRKSKGTYYTPREIVHYMCQQSLINYLISQTCLDKKKINALINPKPITKRDYRKFRKKGGRKNHIVDGSILNLRKKEAKELDDTLESIFVCDPACGSGAFLVGMLNEIVNARKRLAFVLNKNVSLYDLKRDCIQKSLYGVDIDLGAVEIAKLRLWLSLIVDEQDIKRIKPLPNLDYKIMQGNSLIELLSPDLVRKGTDQEKNKLIDKLNDLKNQYFEATNRKRKQNLRDQINKLIVFIANYDKAKELKQSKNLLANLKAQKSLFSLGPENLTLGEIETKEVKKLKKKVQELEKIKDTSPEDHFEWHLNFNEVFDEKGGFDVVIANPPYVRQEKIKDQKPPLQKYEVYNSTSDLYTYFYEKSYNLLENKGTLAFISSNKWLRAKYGEKLRRFFKEKTKILQLIDFNGHKVFEATVDTNVIILQKDIPVGSYQVPFVDIEPDFTGENLSTYLAEHQQYINSKHLNDSGWSLVDEKTLKIKQKIERAGTPLKDWAVKINYGIKTGFNKAFIIDTPTKEHLCREDPKSKEILKPILRGRDIGRYYYRWAGLWLIATFPSLHIDIDQYPAVKNYLLSFGKQRLEQSGKKGARKKTGNKWFETQDNIAYHQEFEKEKIVYTDIAQRLTFSLDIDGYYLANTAYFLTGNAVKYLCAILNSSLINLYYKMISSQLGVRGIRHFSIYIEQLPIIKISQDEQKLFIDLVDKILAITKDDDYLENPAKQAKVREYEKQIDQLVYKLYGLTKEEIKIVENNN
ncbi:hypothetical protein B5M47_01655 [candidate division CPR3 bacterium 4484_211]|uniref:site-specific DNA-methyltransferase (adenine-specific) n=1 Tax=candidate division CPR3 bacterium 4484_211 TaxID=1968527 RepID=A0A1W9NYY6_UNCC3|nr:MAG: hypothetical protein B5M47_01655 [candidate division CPR3 bacterium 4484_211]